MVKAIHTKILEVLDDWDDGTFLAGTKQVQELLSEEDFEEDLRNAIVAALDPIK